MQTLEQQFSIKYTFPVYFTRDVFNAEEKLLTSVLLKGGKKRHKILCIIDSGVLDHHPFLGRRIEHYASVHRDIMELCSPIIPLRGGEKCKNQPAVVESLLADMEKQHLCRQSFVLVIGGGAVLDTAGYAAAIAHRGLRLIRMPTTVLAQNDAGVGVKNGINAMGRKNFLGTFSPPFAVINDYTFLDTLPARELRAGMAEAVKVALIKDRSFFNSLYDRRASLAAFKGRDMEEMIYRCAALHMLHIGTQGDPFEFGSARPLDFGHWSAHKLEELTSSMLNHGEAVSIGMALDAVYSLLIGMIEIHDLQRILTLLTELELPLYHPALETMDVASALDEFREHLGGGLAITLLTGIGSKKEVNRIDTSLMKRSIGLLELYNQSRSIDFNLDRRTAYAYQEVS
ncbi:MAG: 3-dehydroquinate synthase [Desulfobulbaceae bacterium]|nr:3-dehydroquinate synthase [Desulfobulbaceae bacterium]